jgi:hypothetical protein
MDAHGGETIVKTIADDAIRLQVKWLPDQTSPQPFIRQLESAKAAKAFLFEQSKGDLLIPEALPVHTDMQTSYMLLELTKLETAAALENCDRLGAKFRRSCFYLPATALAFATTIAHRPFTNKHILVPMPQDRRRRGRYGPVISNQIAFLFFRFESDVVENLAAMVKSANEQLMDQLRDDHPESYSRMMHLFRRMPLPIYKHMIKSPTQGQMASFYFSDTGQSLEDLNECLGVKIVDAEHFPPNSFPPGLTVVFSQFRGRIRIRICYRNDVFERHRIQTFCERLKLALLEGR